MNSNYQNCYKHAPLASFVVALSALLAVTSVDLRAENLSTDNDWHAVRNLPDDHLDCTRTMRGHSGAENTLPICEQGTGDFRIAARKVAENEDWFPIEVFGRGLPPIDQITFACNRDAQLIPIETKLYFPTQEQTRLGRLPWIVVPCDIQPKALAEDLGRIVKLLKRLSSSNAKVRQQLIRETSYVAEACRTEAGAALDFKTCKQFDLGPIAQSKDPTTFAACQKCRGREAYINRIFEGDLAAAMSFDTTYCVDGVRFGVQSDRLAPRRLVSQGEPDRNAQIRQECLAEAQTKVKKWKEERVSSSKPEGWETDERLRCLEDPLFCGYELCLIQNKYTGPHRIKYFEGAFDMHMNRLYEDCATTSYVDGALNGEVLCFSRRDSDGTIHSKLVKNLKNGRTEGWQINLEADDRVYSARLMKDGMEQMTVTHEVGDKSKPFILSYTEVEPGVEERGPILEPTRADVEAQRFVRHGEWKRTKDDKTEYITYDHGVQVGPPRATSNASQ